MDLIYHVNILKCTKIIICHLFARFNWVCFVMLRIALAAVCYFQCDLLSESTIYRQLGPVFPLQINLPLMLIGELLGVT